MRILGIDLGRSRTGLAISDEGENLAFPLKTVNEKSEEKITQEILNVIDKNNVKKVVIGFPKSTNKKEENSSDFSKKLFKTIKNKRPKLNIFMQDERYTTIIANRYLNEVNFKNKNKKNVIDAVAATVILQSFLDKKI